MQAERSKPLSPALMGLRAEDRRSSDQDTLHKNVTKGKKAHTTLQAQLREGTRGKFALFDLGLD